MMIEDLQCWHIVMLTWLGMTTPGEMQRILTLRVTPG